MPPFRCVAICFNASTVAGARVDDPGSNATVVSFAPDGWGAAAIGGAFGRRKGDPKRGAIAGLTVGLLAPLNWALWRLYNAITDSEGIDTVRNVVINLILFVVLGFGIGVGVGNWKRKHDAKN